MIWGRTVLARQPLHQRCAALALVLVLGVAGCGTKAPGEEAPALAAAEVQRLKAEAMAAGRRGDMPGAVGKLRTAVATGAADAETYQLLGTAYVQLGKPEEAVASLEEARRLDPENYQTHGSLAVVYRHLGRYEDAEASFGEVLRLKPGDLTALGSLGDMGFRTKNFEMCRENFRLYIERADAQDASRMSDLEKRRYQLAQDRLQACEAALQR